MSPNQFSFKTIRHFVSHFLRTQNIEIEIWHLYLVVAWPKNLHSNWKGRIFRWQCNLPSPKIALITFTYKASWLSSNCHFHLYSRALLNMNRCPIPKPPSSLLDIAFFYLIRISFLSSNSPPKYDLFSIDSKQLMTTSRAQKILIKYMAILPMTNLINVTWPSTNKVHTLQLESLVDN